MAESLQHKLSRIRPPRVQITYDVEIGDAIEKKELPFVIGVLADLSHNPETPLARLADRKFVEIDRDNFDTVLAEAAPRVAFRSRNRLDPDSEDALNIELKFSSFEDFEPQNLVKQVPALARLFEARSRLRDLLTKLDGNDKLDDLLRDVIANTEKQEELRAQLGASAPDGEKPADGAKADAKEPDGEKSEA